MYRLPSLLIPSAIAIGSPVSLRASGSNGAAIRVPPRAKSRCPEPNTPVDSTSMTMLESFESRAPILIRPGFAAGQQVPITAV